MAMNDSLECLDGPDGCRGAVELRNPGYGVHCYHRCSAHGAARLDREAENRRRYFGPEPSDFDPADANERWSE